MGVALSAGALVSSCAVRSPRFIETLKIGVIGVGGRGGGNLNAVAGEEIAALCDVDEGRLAGAGERFPGATRFVDFRELIELPGLDAVVISTPDHTHAPAAAAALRRRLAVYCEKPLTHSVHEARTLRRLAREAGVATQMGIQIHANDNYRRVVELVRSGVIGPIRTVRVMCSKTWSGGERPTETPPVPEGLHYDLWLGPAPERPYHPLYLPANWRRWWDFGNGTLGDMACHHMDLAHWALDLGVPSHVSATGPQPHAETTPAQMDVYWRHPATESRPAVEVSWHDGGARPPELAELGLEGWGDGCLFLGDDGWIVANYDRHELGPTERFVDHVPPAPSIATSIGHHAEWIQAAKRGTPTTCPFDYSAALTETVLLGNVAFRSGASFDWDATRLDARGAPAAQELLRRPYRDGWSL
jgi:predicted dehydrogenase